MFRRIFVGYALNNALKYHRVETRYVANITMARVLEAQATIR
jgi:hypothetical protein